MAMQLVVGVGGEDKPGIGREVPPGPRAAAPEKRHALALHLVHINSHTCAALPSRSARAGCLSVAIAHPRSAGSRSQSLWRWGSGCQPLQTADGPGTSLSSRARQRVERLACQLELPDPSLQLQSLIPLSDQPPLRALCAAHGAAVLASACPGTLGFGDREQAALMFSGNVPRQYVHHPVSPSPRVRTRASRH